MQVFKKQNTRILSTCLLVTLFSVAVTAQTGFQHVWSKVVTSNAIQGGNTIGNGIVADAQGNSYVVGSFVNAVDMDPGPDSVNLLSRGSSDVFVAKFTAGGSLLWARQLGGTDFEAGKGIALDAAGNVYITGTFNGTISVDMPFGNAKLTSVGNTNFFVAKFSNNGQYQMAFADGFGFDQGNSIAVDAAGNILVGGSGNASGGLRTAYFAKYNAAGVKQFLHRVGGGSNEWVQRIAADADNNIYITGNMQWEGDYDPGPNTLTLTPAVVGVFDVFMAKYDPAGNSIFANKVGGNNRDEVFDMALDVNGNMYITGNFEVTGDFDPGPNEAIITGAAVNRNIFFAKYTSSGAYVYAKALGAGTLSDNGRGITADAAGNAYITGSFSGTADFDPGAGSAPLAAPVGFVNGYFAAYNPSGEYIMAKNIGAEPADAAVSSGKLYLTGEFGGSPDFDPSPNTVQLTTTGVKNAFVAGYTLSGDYAYASQMGNYFNTVGPLNEVVNQSVTDADGNIYIIGNFSGQVDFDPGPNFATLTNPSNTTTDVFFAKYSSAGDLVFAKQIGANGNDIGFSIAVDANKNIIITGGFTLTVDFDPGAGTANLVNGSGTQQDFFLAKYDLNGNYLWAHKFGNTNTVDQGRYVTVDAGGNIYVTGLFTGTVDADFGDGTANLTSGPSFADMFVAKYNASGTYQLAFSIGGPNSKFPNQLLTDNEGNMYLMGTFVGAIDADPGAGSVVLSSGSTVGADVFFAKYSNTGAYLMAKKIGSSTVGLSETVNAMALAANGDILITGGFAQTMDFDPGAGTANLSLTGGTAMYIARYSTTGDYVWAKMIGSTGTNTTGTTLGLEGSNVVVAGIFNGPNDMDPGDGTVMATPTAGGNNIFLVMLNTQGDYVSSGWLGGSGPMQAVTRGLHADAQGNLTMAGIFSNIGDFDPTPATLSQSGSNGNDIFLAKFTSSAAPSQYVTTQAGAWTDPATWIGGQVPPPGAAVKLLHVVQVTTNITVKSLEAASGGGVNVAGGASLTVLE